MNTSIDYKSLTQKVNYSKRLHEFYQVAIQCMVEKFHVERYFDKFNMENRFPAIPKQILNEMRQGIAPSYESILLADTTELDAMVWEVSFLLGTVLGVMNLTTFEHDEGYAEWLQDEPNEDEMLTRWGFASLSLAHELPPSKELLLQLFPIGNSKSQNEKSLNLLFEINQIPYIRFIREISGVNKTD